MLVRQVSARILQNQHYTILYYTSNDHLNFTCVIVGGSVATKLATPMI